MNYECVSQKKGTPIILQHTYKKALTTNRSQLLKKRDKNDNTTHPIRIIGTYDEAGSSVRAITAEHWDILLMDPDLNNHLDKHPTLTFRHSKNLCDKLMHSHYVPPQTTGNWLVRQIKGCNKCRGCIVCKFIDTGSTFSSSTTKQIYKINYFINCRSTRTIYLATYSYGHSMWVKPHVTSGDARNQRNISLLRHLWQKYDGSISNIRLKGINHFQVTKRRGNIEKVILQRESYWIFTLKTVVPYGLKKRLHFGCFTVFER